MTRKAVYTHSDGRREVVDVRKIYLGSEGGGYSIFIPSLSRERDIPDHKLDTSSYGERAAEQSPLGTFIEEATPPEERDEAVPSYQQDSEASVACPARQIDSETRAGNSNSTTQALELESSSPTTTSGAPEVKLPSPTTAPGGKLGAPSRLIGAAGLENVLQDGALDSVLNDALSDLDQSNGAVT
jgi:hypothetical protein